MKNILYGAIIGDICGSVYERSGTRIKYCPENLLMESASFTDDTVHTIAIADALINNKEFKDSVIKWSFRYSNVGFGKMFKEWLFNDGNEPYGSYGNGSAMRVSPIGWQFEAKETMEYWTWELAQHSSEFTHNHEEGIDGAIATAACIFELRLGKGKEGVKGILEDFYPEFKYTTIEDAKKDYKFDATCKGTVPYAILAFLEGNTYEEVIKLAISLGGDSDTLAAIAGSIAVVIYDIPQYLIDFANTKLTNEIKEVITNFDNYINEKY